MPDSPFRAVLPADPAGADLWVFGYGSLMWDPGFACAEQRPALLRGYHRRFCIYSHHYRGTPECPGLVLGLDRGGACRGVAFRVPAAQATTVVDYLWRREMISGVYRPKLLPVRHADGIVRACAFVADRHHAQYCGRLDLARTAALIRHGAGTSGSNIDYLASTVAHLEQLGIKDRALRALLSAVQATMTGWGRAAG